VPDLQYEGAGKRRALYRTLPYSTADPPAAFWEGSAATAERIQFAGWAMLVNCLQLHQPGSKVLKQHFNEKLLNT